MASTWTVRSLLIWAREWLAEKGVDSPRLDAELLLAHALGCSRTKLYVDFDKPLSPEELARVKPLLQRRARREPVAYILGVREFYGRPFRVRPGVFIPRPETELLVQVAIEAIPAEARILDLCAGSGAVGVSIAAELPGARVDLVEASPDAAAVARENAEALAPGRFRVFEGDLFAALPRPTRYDAVVANPPYVAEGERERLAPEIVAHEPPQALFASDGGLAVIRRIVSDAAAWLVPGGFLGMEIDPSLSATVRELCTQAGFRNVRVVKDLAGLDRHVLG
ncbi:MAG TPA: peptide chain release factor N(5)-glutamine methyltransferase, partial [Myxococcales bacterium]|nr:peptide chain release factor N(5)-glutamine methyltransferase [Myxococcales bacterium]